MQRRTLRTAGACVLALGLVSPAGVAVAAEHSPGSPARAAIAQAKGKAGGDSSSAQCQVRIKKRTVVTSGAGAVQAAVNQANAGDKLTITGTCHENDITIGKNLTLNGNGTIDAAQQGRVIYSTADITITGGLTITGGDSTNSTSNPGYGAGITNIGGSVTLREGSITGNNAPFNGGGIYSDGGSLTINGGVISNNYGGIGGGGGIFSTGTITLNGGAIANNNASTGGGAMVYGTMTINGGTVTGNTSLGAGGGIFNYNHVTLNGGTIADNSADLGGGIMAISGTTALKGGAITANDGGGIYCDGGLTGDQSIVYGNTPFDVQCF